MGGYQTINNFFWTGLEIPLSQFGIIIQASKAIPMTAPLFISSFMSFI